LSIVHFWTLVFLYIWAGPHHLLYTALPDWAQTLGMVFSLMLWAPSWGGMLNGLLTLRGAWDKLRTDPVIKFLIVAVTFYGMATFEGPLLAIKSVNALAHYSDWIIGHVHSGALGWNGFMAAGMLYWLVPRLWGTKLYSIRLANAHFWIATFGILMYVASMWVSGVSQGLFFRALDSDGFLKYPDFIEGLISSRYMFHMRILGGLAYFVGFGLLAVNLARTIRAGKAARAEVQVARVQEGGPGFWRLVFSPPVLISAVVVAACVVLGTAGVLTGIVALVFLEVLVVAVIVAYSRKRNGKSWHDMVEGNSLAFSVLVLVAILIGGLVELIPTVVLKRDVPEQSVAVAEAPPDTPAEYDFVQTPYSPLELAGRDIYVREGCYVCHSQMVRPFRHETLRYGEYSRAGEFIYDRPFQWSSKRTGPDLHRAGGKYANLWHYLHFDDPRSTSPGSIMPAYDFLRHSRVDLEEAAKRMRVLQKLGVPYSDSQIDAAAAELESQGQLIVDDLATGDVQLDFDSEMVALIAYMQRLGRGPQPYPYSQARASLGEED
jgi:cytochrome c oxidase cbb3-type subunit I/II